MINFLTSFHQVPKQTMALFQLGPTCWFHRYRTQVGLDVRGPPWRHIWLLVLRRHSLPNSGVFSKDVVTTASRSIQDTRHPSMIRSGSHLPCSRIHPIPHHIPQVWRNLAYSEQIVTDLHPTSVLREDTHSLKYTLFYIVARTNQALASVFE